jgi:hypothetical protein
MEDVMSSARSRPRFLTLLLTLFSSLSLIPRTRHLRRHLYAVAQRNEIGIRMASAARRRRRPPVSTSGVLSPAGTVVERSAHSP